MCRSGRALASSLLFVAVPLVVACEPAPSARGTAPSSTGARPPANGSASSAAARGTPLREHAPVTREMKKGQVDVFEVAATAGQVVLGAVDQRGVDLILGIFAPDGTKIADVDSPNGTNGPEPIVIVAKVPGTYLIEVKPLPDSPPPGDAGATAATDAGPAPPVEAPGSGPAVGGYEAHIEIVTAAEYERREAKRKIDSPRIFQLWVDVRQDGQAAADRFIEELRGKAPLVEPVAGDSKQVLVTFVARGEKDTKYLGLRGGPSTDEKAMIPLEGSDLWTYSVKMPSDSRFLYRFSTERTPPRFSELVHAWDNPRVGVVDPLNPRTFLLASLVELPDAPPRHWSIENAAAPRGQMNAEVIDSKALGESRKVGVYTPAGFDPGGGPYHLLVVFDGEAYGTDAAPIIPTPQILDNLTAAKKIPPTVAALVASGETRIRDLTASQPFVDFLATELVPMLRAKYHVSTRPADATLAGSSYGGLCAARIAFQHSEIFGNVLSQSGAFAFYPDERTIERSFATEPNWMSQQFIASPRLPIKFYLEAGRFEAGFFSELLAENRHLRDVLRLKGYTVAYAEFDGGHDNLTWRESLAEGLIALAE